jgi:uncharacterized protein (DUF362 family)
VSDIVVVTGSLSLDPEVLQDALEQVLTTLAETDTAIEFGDQSVLLPSLISLRTDTHENTSAALLHALVKVLQAQGTKPSIGGNPPHALPGPKMLELFERSGILAVCEATGVRPLLDQRTTIVPLPGGKTAKFFAVAAYVPSACSVVGVPRLRATEPLLSGAVRGMTSAVPGFKREEIKLALEQVDRYAEQLVDLTLAVQPTLTVLEADGKASPDTRSLIVSTNPFTADVVAAHLLALEPTSVATIRAAARRGLGPSCVDEVAVISL